MVTRRRGALVLPFRHVIGWSVFRGSRWSEESLGHFAGDDDDDDVADDVADDDDGNGVVDGDVDNGVDVDDADDNDDDDNGVDDDDNGVDDGDQFAGSLSKMDGHFGEPDPLHQGGDGVDNYGTQEKVTFER